jgi:hypothetical protein
MATELNLQNNDVFINSLTSTGVVAATTLIGDGNGLTNLPLSSITSFQAKAYLINDATVNDSTVYTQKNVFPTTLNINDGGFTVSSAGIVIPDTGIYICGVSAYFVTAATQRANVGVTFTVNGTAQTEVGANSYIRVGNGHNEATAHLTTILSLTSGDELGVAFAQLSAAGAVTLTSNGTEDSHVFLYRIA